MGSIPACGYHALVHAALVEVARALAREGRVRLIPRVARGGRLKVDAKDV